MLKTFLSYTFIMYYYLFICFFLQGNNTAQHNSSTEFLLYIPRILHIDSIGGSSLFLCCIFEDAQQQAADTTSEFKSIP